VVGRAQPRISSIAQLSERLRARQKVRVVEHKLHKSTPWVLSTKPSDVVCPYDVDPFRRGCAGEDDGRGLAADGREVGESRAGAWQDHRVTPERQQILRGALLPTIWCHAGQHKFVAAVLRRSVQLGHQVGVELVPDGEADADQPGLLSAQQLGAGVGPIADLGRSCSDPGPGLVAGSRSITEHDLDECSGDAGPEGDVLHGWSPRLGRAANLRIVGHGPHIERASN
jgi:hypothetical protein